jgi:hypothetical protein
VSNVTAPALWKDSSFPNPSISVDKWSFNEDSKEWLEKLITLGGLLLIFAAVVFLFSPVFPALHDEGNAFLITFGVSLAAGIFFLPKIAKKAVARKEHKRDEYRAANAHIILDGLAEFGWKLDSKDAVGTLVKDNNPYVVNADGVRYYISQLYIGRDEIHVMFSLSDEKAKEDIKENEKQREIDFFISRYEEANGPMSAEKKAGFVAALELAL